MACGVPTISTPVPANIKINRGTKIYLLQPMTNGLEAFRQIILNQSIL